MAGKYDDLTHAQLVELLEKRDRTKKLGLVWERDDIEADLAVDANFVACRIVPELSDKPAPWDNLVIEGDNFDALRWLRMTHAGRVKCIYIDPPYNTGNKDWVYNDRYMNPEDRFRQSTWLEFLYRRLTLARDLLAEDGVLLVSINDDQRALLELMMDEALPGMRLGSLVWRTRDTTSAKGGNFSDVHEHILVYAKPGFIFRGSDKSKKKYKNPDNDPRGIWNIDPLTLAFDRRDRENLYYPLHDPCTDIWYQSTGTDDLVIDFFSGSATTAQAVMELNAEDGGRRRFIIVSSTEATEEDPDKNLCRDVTAERIRRLNASKDSKYTDLAAAFAYLRTHEIAFEDLDYDLTPADSWAALEAMHDLPLTPYDPALPWNLHEGEGTVLVLVDRFDPSLLDWLRDRDRQNLFVYAWAPGQIAQHLDRTHVDIRPVRETLVKRFQQ